MASFNLFEPHKRAKRKRNLVEFRAGKMTMDSENWVYPDNRKGLLFIHESLDGLMHLCWKDRISDNIEDDLIIFPNESEFKRIPECKTGRVYLLKFKDSKKHFFWMQEPKEERDAELCQLVNDVLNKRNIIPEEHEGKSMNINDFTDLLGELHEMGALNDLDIVEILGSHFSGESDATVQQNTHPFPVGNYPSTSKTEEVREDWGNRKMTNHTTVSTIEVKGDLRFSPLTLTKLSENRNFRAKFMPDCIEQKLNPEHQKRCEAEFETAIMEFLVLLEDEKTAKSVFKDIGFPESLIKKKANGELIDLVEAIDNYYLSQQPQQKDDKNNTKQPP